MDIPNTLYDVLQPDIYHCSSYSALHESKDLKYCKCKLLNIQINKAKCYPSDINSSSVMTHHTSSPSSILISHDTSYFIPTFHTMANFLSRESNYFYSITSYYLPFLQEILVHLSVPAGPGRKLTALHMSHLCTCVGACVTSCTGRYVNKSCMLTQSPNYRNATLASISTSI